MPPYIQKLHINLPPPSLNDNASDLSRLLAGLKARGIEGIYTPLSIMASLPRVMRVSGFEITASVAFEDRPRLVAVEQGDTTATNIGLAIDLGTTNVVGALVDMNTGCILVETSRHNPQIAHGEDILNRIHHCTLDPGGLERLQSLIAGCISEIAAAVTDISGHSINSLNCVSISGNTTMAHLFLGIDPQNICLAPYAPVANRFGYFRVAELIPGINPEASVYVLPNVGSYVGGDVLAGVLVSGMHLREDISLMVDIGTNAEIVIGNRDWLLVCAGAAGPALEGGVVKSGMRAMPGAIERVRIDPVTLEPVCSVIGGGKPVGLCGSALIDIIAELFTTGIIDERGKFSLPVRSRRVIEIDDRHAYVVVSASDSGMEHDIIITEMDIDNLVRTKAAMFTVLHVVTKEIGISFDDLLSFNIAGTFGQYIAADKAVAIGMVPDIELSRYALLGNTSLKGGCAVLADRSKIEEINVISSMITYKEMNVSSDFMSEFRAAMFIPHTDASLFSSVKKHDIAKNK